MRTNYGLYLQSTLSVDTVQTRPDIYPQDQFNVLTFLLHLCILFKKNISPPPRACRQKKKKIPAWHSRTFLFYNRGIVFLGLEQVSKR